MKTIPFNKTCWHDGNIITFNYVFPLSKKDKTKIIITAELYKDDKAPQRRRVEVIFNDIQKINKKLDFIEIADNVCAGSLNFVEERELQYNKSRFYEYKVNIFGGKLSLISKKVKIKGL